MVLTQAVYVSNLLVHQRYHPIQDWQTRTGNVQCFSTSAIACDAKMVKNQPICSLKMPHIVLSIVCCLAEEGILCWLTGIVYLKILLESFVKKRKGFRHIDIIIFTNTDYTNQSINQLHSSLLLISSSTSYVTGNWQVTSQLKFNTILSIVIFQTYSYAEYYIRLML